MVADPIVQIGSLAVIGTLVTRTALRGHPTWRLVGQVAFFAALTALLLYYGIVPYEPGPSEASILQQIFVGLAKIIWWMNAAWALISFVRVFLIFERRPREGRLLQDLVVGMIYVGAVLSVIANVFSVPVGTLIATSGIFAIILGLAMQSTLSDVFSGIALNLGRPYVVGDWIVLDDGVEGQVVETNWRATYILDGKNDLVIVPNSNLAKARLTNLSSPDRSHGITLAVRFVPTTSPAAISEVMRAVLLSTNAILPDIGSSVVIKSLDANAVEVDLTFRVADFSTAAAVRSEVFDLIYRHSKATGLKLSPPSQAAGVSVPSASSDAAASQPRSTQLRLLDAIPLFSSLTEDEKEALAATMTRRTYRKDAIIAEQGVTLTSLMIVRSGVLAITRREQEREIELARLAPGDCFGETGLLTAAGEAGTIRAMTFVVVYEIAQAGLAPILHDRPGLAEDLGLTLARRSKTEKHLLGHDHDEMELGSVPRLVARIRHLFDLPRVQ